MRHRPVLALFASASLLAGAALVGTGSAVVLAPAPALTEPGPALEVNLDADQHPIRPHVYGMNLTDDELDGVRIAGVEP